MNLEGNKGSGTPPKISTPLVTALSAIGSGYSHGDLVSIILHKKGQIRQQKTYDDDLVQVLIWAGFDYHVLVRRSQKKLNYLWGETLTLIPDLLKAVSATHPQVTLTDVTQAIQEVDQSFSKVLSGGTSESSDTDASRIWGPLVVNGHAVKGAKVYQGKGDAQNPSAPVPGTIYLDGLKLGERIIAPAANGTWNPKQAPKTVCKETLRSWLPVGLYVRYSLVKERLFLLKTGSDASNHAKAEGLMINPDTIRDLFKGS